MYASTSARRASASIRRAPSRTSSSITDDAADRAAPEPSRSAESETTVSIGSYLPDQRLPRRSSLEPSIGHPGRYAPSQADPQISSIAPVDGSRPVYGWNAGRGKNQARSPRTSAALLTIDIPGYSFNYRSISVANASGPRAPSGTSGSTYRPSSAQNVRSDTSRLS